MTRHQFSKTQHEATMRRPMMITDPAIFVARGLSLEVARAEALQADRAVLLQRTPGFQPRRWFTHAELPEDPYKPASSCDGDPWDEPSYLFGVERVFAEGLFSRSMRTLLTYLLLKEFAEIDRRNHFASGDGASS